MNDIQGRCESVELSKKCDLPAKCRTAILEYRLLEEKVGDLISRICGSECRQCSGYCCQKDICKESLDSSWLKMVWQWDNPCELSFHCTKGWLSSNGCRLSVGRPPVCYEYYCDRIENKVVKKVYLSSFLELLKLINYMGQNALGHRHLVTLTSQDIKKKINFKKLRHRIMRARDLFTELKREMKLF